MRVIGEADRSAEVDRVVRRQLGHVDVVRRLREGHDEVDDRQVAERRRLRSRTRHRARCRLGDDRAGRGRDRRGSGGRRGWDWGGRGSGLIHGRDRDVGNRRWDRLGLGHGRAERDGDGCAQGGQQAVEFAKMPGIHRVRVPPYESAAWRSPITRPAVAYPRRRASTSRQIGCSLVLVPRKKNAFPPNALRKKYHPSQLFVKRKGGREGAPSANVTEPPIGNRDLSDTKGRPAIRTKTPAPPAPLESEPADDTPLTASLSSPSTTRPSTRWARTRSSRCSRRSRRLKPIPP